MANRSDPTGQGENRIEDVTAALRDRYELVLLPILMAFMFTTRYLSADNFRSEDGFYLAAIDSYYHWRSTMYTVENWPNTMPYEVWTAWSDGRYVGQFGTAFDQLIATIALIVGLGNPSETLVHEVVLVMIPLLAALVAIPVYLIGKRLGGKFAGVASVALLALFPGSFFSRSAVGQHQHHVAEVLFMGIAILAFMAALRVAEQEKPVWELVLDRDVAALKPTIVYSVLAGFALSVYMWMWPSGMLLIGILGIFFIFYLSIEYLSGRSPEHLAFVGAIAMIVTGVLMLGQIEEMSTSSTSFGYQASLLAFAVAAGSIFMAWLARFWDSRGIEQLLYPVGIAGSVIIALGILQLLDPGIVTSMFDEFIRRMTPLSDHVTDQTIQEANPPGNYSDQAFREFGLALYTGIIGLIILIVSPLLGRQGRAEHGLIVVWAIIIFSMSATQVRFWYYLAIVVAILNAVGIGLVVKWADIEGGIESARNIEGYQIIALATVVMILVVPLMPPVASFTVVDMGNNQFPHSDTQSWEESLEYLESSTPEVGHWGGADNPLEYYGPYERPADGSFEYPEGAYGVISWWDYGHLITVQGERIPHSNPFQTNADSSAAFLLADSEERGSLILDAIPTGESIQGASDEELRDIVSERTDQDKQEQTRYIMIDDAMVGGKFGAITTWNEEDQGQYMEMDQVQTMTGEEFTAQRMNDDYYETMMGQLYYGQADGMEQYRMIHESSEISTFASVGIVDEGDQLRPFVTNVEVSDIIRNLRNAGVPVGSLQDVIAHPSLEVYDIQQVPEVRTFERVEGAAIEGTASDENASTVQASLVLNTTTTEQPFAYTQTAEIDEDGSFSLTVPYATNDELGVEDGYTDSDVFAEDDYSVTVFDENGTVLEEGDVAVPETGIYEGDTYEVTLEIVEDEEEEADENGETDEEENGETDEETETNDEDADNTTDTNSTDTKPMIRAIT